MAVYDDFKLEYVCSQCEKKFAYYDCYRIVLNDRKTNSKIRIVLCDDPSCAKKFMKTHGCTNLVCRIRRCLDCIGKFCYDLCCLRVLSS